MNLPKKVLALVLLCLAVSYATGNAEGALQNCSVPSSEFAITSDEQELLNLVNSYRQENGKGSLSMDSGLVQAASWMSADRASASSLGHTDSLGRDTSTRLSECGYSNSGWAENLYMGSNNATDAFNAWKNSPGHNANMLGGDYKAAGISVNGSYWAINFGSSVKSPAISKPAVDESRSVLAATVSPTSETIPTPTITQAPTTAVTPTIFPNQPPTQLFVSISLAGIGVGKNNSPKKLTRQVVVGIYSLNNRLILTGTGFLKYDRKGVFKGDVSLGQIANGTYYVKVVSDYTLISLINPQFKELKYDQLNTIPNVELVQGDYNTDNVVDINDFNIALLCFQGGKCPVKDTIDLNDDGKSDIVDYNLFLGNFRQYEGD